MSKRQGDPGYAPGWCIHFRSMGRHDTCEKGVPYNSFKKEDRTLQRCPCYNTKGDKAFCEHRRLPTKQEIAAHEEWQAKSFNKLATVLEAIRPWRMKWSREGINYQETIECPLCKGRLYLTISGCNGHIHGRCHTEGCVAWME